MGTVSTVVNLGCAVLVQSIAILFKIRPCLCFGTVLCHLVTIFFPIFASTFCLTISPRCPQRCYFKPRSVAFSNLSAKNPSTCAALLINNKDAGLAVGSQPRVLMCCPQSFPRRGTTRCNPVPQHTMFMAGRVSLSLVFEKKRSNQTTSLNTKEFGERFTMGPAGRFCASQALQR